MRGLALVAMTGAMAAAPEPAGATCIGIGCTCGVSATDVSFGTYDPFSASDTLVTGDVAVTCSALVAGLNVSYVIALDDGVHGSYAARAMNSGGETLSYNLYADAPRVNVWGDGAGGTVTVADSYLLALLFQTRHYTVYGTLPKAQNVGPGSYSDTITVTVTF